MSFLEDTTKTISSLEIANLCGKLHKNVIRDIQVQIKDGLRFERIYLDKYGRKKPCYCLPFRETMIVVSGYDANLRTKIIDRWLELERKQNETSSLGSDLLKAKGNTKPFQSLVWSILRILQGEGQFCTVPVRAIREIVCKFVRPAEIWDALACLEEEGWVIKQVNPGKPNSYSAIVPSGLKYNINVDILRDWTLRNKKPQLIS